MNLKKIGKLFGLEVALAILALAAGNQGGFSLAQAECTVTLKPSQSIQEAINQAEEGAVICLAEGTWMENITIAKGLTLRGAGQDKSIVKGAEWDYPVIRIESDSEIEVTLEGLTVAEAKSDDGIEIGGKAKVTIKDSTVSRNGDGGLSVWNYANVSLTNSTVSGNGVNGLYVRDSAKVTIKGSKIEENGTDEACARADYICNGIKVGVDSQTTIIDSIIRNNTDWGVAAWLWKCRYYGDFFTGKVIFKGNNVIEGSNTSGNQNGMGNPGDHPWNRPEVPDGQVCLP